MLVLSLTGVALAFVGFLCIGLVVWKGCSSSRFSEALSKQQGGKYLIAYSYSKELSGGQTVHGDGNYLTDNEVTDFVSLEELVREIAMVIDVKVEKVVILNIIVL